MRKIQFFISLFFLFPMVSKAQTNFPVYTNLCHGAHKIIVNADGSFVVIGTIGDEGKHSFNSTIGGSIIKYDVLGNMLWHSESHSNFSAGNYMYFSDMIKSLDSGYIVVGDSTYITGMATRPNYSFLIKFNENGDRLWTKSIKSNEPNDWGFNIKLEKSVLHNEYYCSGNDSFYKFNQFGDSIFSVANPGIMNNFRITKNEGVIGTNGALICKLTFADSLFGLLHADTILGSNHLNNYDIILTSDSNWIATGRTVITNSSWRITVNKFNYSGILKWSKSYNYNAIIEGVHLVEWNNNYYITCTNKTCLNSDTSYHCYGVSNATIIETDTAGNELATLQINGNATNLDSVKSYYGFQSAFRGDTIYTVGSSLLFYEYGLSGETLNDIGLTVWKNTIHDFTSVNIYNKNIDNLSFQIQPNPANDFIYISAPNFENLPVNIIIKNMLGQEFFNYTTSKFSANFKISTANWKQGVYNVILKSAENTHVKKFVITH